MGKSASYHQVPIALQGQLQMLFGMESTIGKSSYLTEAQFKKIVLRVLDELERYMVANVHTDPEHQDALQSALRSARVNVSQDYWWPGVFEGVVRFALLLMGDQPNHLRRPKIGKRKDRYTLSRHRTACWIQNDSQRFRLLWKMDDGGVKLSKKAWEFFAEFRDKFGTRASYHDFLTWFRTTYPEDYAKVY